GKDASGNDAFFAVDRDFVANRAKVAELKTVYRHGAESVKGNSNHAGRLFASPVANSDDGKGAELQLVDKSWHPFYNKIYDDGILTQIRMPKAEVGFAVASHHLYLTEGHRRISIKFDLRQPVWAGTTPLLISFTTEKGWHTLSGSVVIGSIIARSIGFGSISLPQLVPANSVTILFDLDADAPAFVPWNAKVHGGDFNTGHPVLKIVLKNEDNTTFNFFALENIAVRNCTVKVAVGADLNGNPLSQPGLKNLAVNTDFGPVDLSKPFQPFGSAPETGSALTVGHKEVFQKSNVNLKLKVVWKGTPGSGPKFSISSLNKGNWESPSAPYSFTSSVFQYSVPASALSPVDYQPNEIYTVEDTSGFLRLTLSGNFGHKAYPAALATYIVEKPSNPGSTPPPVPYTPEIESLSLCYTAESAPIQLDSTSNKDVFGGKFYHLSAFGMAERHPALNGGAIVSLFPQFQHGTTRHEAEFYIGISGLKPPQNLALLFQVAEGTADPLSQKPVPHLHWSYLSQNNWMAFEKDAVEDLTGELTRSGIVTLAMPRGAGADNTLLPGGMHWIRIAVEKESDTVCRFILVAAQALRATFADQNNDPGFTASPLEAGVISKLAQPESAVKKVEQPFSSFGGRGKEASDAYYTRVSERLRHKGRAIALWDYERLVLEAFPQIYKVKCLNHTHYEPNESGTGVYRELAAGHVTIVTIPNQQFQNLRDPLRPYTSLGLLLEIDAFLRERVSCFVKLHVKNPQFEEIRLQFRVRFMPGFDETYFTNQLRQEITRYLSPWAFSGGTPPSFGGKIFKSVLINFVEERPYVDYVTDFKMFLDIGGIKGAADMNEVEGSTAVSILVSAPDDKHQIIPITVAGLPATAQVSGEDCSCKQ
ncbi:MAG: baseplate J/gp47 family protein, partial [Saprospiraceae bacterium]|nr:baseplate J/gp47 family protein [Saprospiraceae bacterium]